MTLMLKPSHRCDTPAKKEVSVLLLLVNFALWLRGREALMTQGHFLRDNVTSPHKRYEKGSMDQSAPLPESSDAAPQSNRAVDEAAVLSTLVSSLAPVDQAGRIRLFKTLCTFFDLPFTERGATSQPPATQAHFSGAGGGHAHGAPSSFSEIRTPSPKAFLLEKRPQTESERVACLAYYFTHYRNEPHFKTLDLSKLNTEAAQIKFSNPARAVDNAAASMFLIPAGQGKKQLSAIGELYVQSLPDRAAARQATADLRRKKPRRTNKSSEGDTVQTDAVENDADESGTQ
ncbi:hypothetical protein [Cupriavidus metallidurans]|uniref:hypothetical protein n=1 Tax=Cupriavidus metallidurans TaxID=119219 RepID=UPI00113FF0D0|nr:hypothetical protein [Cupriavidus metallidurans]